jgi:mono/diheme cytochrome c family protein
VRRLLPLLVLLAACKEPTGEAVFAGAGCAACHRVGAVGGDTGPDLSLVGLRRSPDWLDAWLRDPGAVRADATMPRPRLEDGDRRAVVEYLAGLKAAPPWSLPAPPAEAGKVLYLKAGCVACHGPAGRGGIPNRNAKGGRTPSLAETVPTFTDEELARKLLEGAAPLKEEPEGPEPSAMPAWKGVLTEEQLSAVRAYLKTLGRPGEEW